jgi:hypothetical protein
MRIRHHLSVYLVSIGALVMLAPPALAHHKPSSHCSPSRLVPSGGKDPRGAEVRLPFVFPSRRRRRLCACTP